MKYLVKVTYVATNDNPNFAGETNVYWSGKGSKSEKDNFSQYFLENYGYSRLCDAKKNWDYNNQEDSPVNGKTFWIKTAEIVKVA